MRDIHSASNERTAQDWILASINSQLLKFRDLCDLGEDQTVTKSSLLL
jgi:hypothetical protein